MLDVTFNETVTLRRASARDARNKITWQEVLDESGGPLRLKCRIERRRRRIFSQDGVEREIDATMAYRKTSAPDLRLEDVMVTQSGEAFKITGLDELAILFGTATYGRAELRRTREVMPADQHAGN